MAPPFSDPYFSDPYGAPPPPARPMRGPGPGSGPVSDTDHVRPGVSIEPPQVDAFVLPASHYMSPDPATYLVPQYEQQQQQQQQQQQPVIAEPHHQQQPTTEPHMDDASSRHSYHMDILPPVMADEDLDEGGHSPVSDATKNGYVSVTDLDPDAQPAYAYPAPVGYSTTTTIPNLAPPVPNLTLSTQTPHTTAYTGAGTHPSTHQPFLPAPAPSTGNNTRHYDTNKPTCSLNLVCYRPGREGCRLEQVQCALPAKSPADQAMLQSALATNPRLVSTDAAFFREMRRLFDGSMSSPWRRWLSLKTLKGFRILSLLTNKYTPTSRPTIVPFDGFILQEMMYAYLNPTRVSSSDDWIRWVFRLRRADRRHAVEFVEGWDSTRIAVAGLLPWLASCLVAIVWTAAGGDPQTTFTVASFILTSSSIILALLAIVSSIESSGNNIM